MNHDGVKVRIELKSNELSELLQIRRDKLDELRGLGIDPFGGKYRTHASSQAHSGRVYEDKPRKSWRASTSKSVMAGRIMQKRGMGKASFAHIQDLSGKIQIYVRKDPLRRSSIQPSICWISAI